MTARAVEHEDKELPIDEIIEDAMTFLDFGPEVMTLAEPDGYYRDMTTEEFELTRASIAYLAYRLLLMYRLKRANVRGSGGAPIAFQHFQRQVRLDIARVLGIRGAEFDRIEEVKRLYKVAGAEESKGGAYSKQIDGILEDFIDRYELDAVELGVVFIY